MVKKVKVKVKVKVVFNELKKQFKDPAVRRRVAKKIRGTSTFPKPPPDDTKKVVAAVAGSELAAAIAEKVQNKPISPSEIPKLTKEIQITVQKTPWYKNIDNYFKIVVITFYIIKSLQYLSKLRPPHPIGVRQHVRSPTRSPARTPPTPSPQISPNRNNITAEEMNIRRRWREELERSPLRNLSDSSPPPRRRRRRSPPESKKRR